MNCQQTNPCYLGIQVGGKQYYVFFKKSLVINSTLPPSTLSHAEKNTMY